MLVANFARRGMKKNCWKITASIGLIAFSQMIPVMPTLHPAYLLRRPADKKLAWRDLQAIEDKINSLGLLEPKALAD